MKSVKSRIILAASFLALSVWHAEVAKTQEPATPVLVSVCDLATKGGRYDGRRLQVRAAFEFGVEFIRLFDQACSNSMIFLGSVKEGIDVTLCNSEELVNKYGCPANSDTGVRTTFLGVYHQGRRKVGKFDVESMLDIRVDGVSKQRKKNGT